MLAGRRAFIPIECSVVSTVAGELRSLVSTASRPCVASEIHLHWPLGCALQAIQGTCWGLIHMQVHATKDPDEIQAKRKKPEKPGQHSCCINLAYPPGTESRPVELSDDEASQLG